MTIPQGGEWNHRDSSVVPEKTGYSSPSPRYRRV